QDDDPYATRYGCFLPDLTGLAGRPSAACLRPRYRPLIERLQGAGTGPGSGRFPGSKKIEEAVGRAPAETPMLRTLIFALLGASRGLAAAEGFPQAVVGSEVRGDNGVVIGHVTAVQRDRHGRIIAVEIPGVEPPDASALRPRVIVHNDEQRALRVLVN